MAESQSEFQVTGHTCWRTPRRPPTAMSGASTMHAAGLTPFTFFAAASRTPRGLFAPPASRPSSRLLAECAARMGVSRPTCLFEHSLPWDESSGVECQTGSQETPTCIGIGNLAETRNHGESTHAGMFRRSAHQCQECWRSSASKSSAGHLP